MTFQILGPKVIVKIKDRHIQKIFTHNLRQNSYRVKTVSTLEEGIYYASSNNYQLLIIDVDLKLKNNQSLIKGFRKKNQLLPILAIGENNHLIEILAYEIGINIYHPKPIRCDLLKAQIQLLTIFFRQNLTFKLGNIIINPLLKTITIGKKKVKLTTKEFYLLLLLIKAEGKTLSRKLIFTHVYGCNAEASTSSIDTLVCRLRHKLEDTSTPIFIETMYKIGYKINLKYLK